MVLNSAEQKHQEKEKTEKFFEDSGWYKDTIMTMGSYPNNDPKDDDAVLYGSWNDDFYGPRYDSLFSLNKANDNILAKLKPSNSNVCNSSVIKVAYSVLKCEN